MTAHNINKLPKALLILLLALLPTVSIIFPSSVNGADLATDDDTVATTDTDIVKFDQVGANLALAVTIYQNINANPGMVALRSLPPGTWGNPLAHCPGYTFSRGLTATHHGVDFAKRGGCPIVSAAAGRVTFVGWQSLSGYNITVDHGSGIETHYFHAAANSFAVSVGQHVEKGQDLMYMGETGNATGIHLHFELFVDKKYLNPLDYVPF